MRAAICTRSLHNNIQCAAKVSSQRSAIPPTRRSFVGGALVSMMALTGGSKRSAFAASQIDEAAQVLLEPNWPEKFPFTAEYFERYDESKDTLFYDQPRIVTHIDDNAIKALTKFYEENFPASGNQDVALLDVCSSWISHYPANYTAGRIAGLGMNAEELSRNSALTEYTVHDLNEDPKLPYADNSFDVITNAVSVDYLTKPMEVFAEMQRCLKPGGLAIMSFSNRCFPTKAIALWTSTGDLDHCWIVGAYFHYTKGFEAPAAKDITISKSGDPMYVVYARKSAA